MIRLTKLNRSLLALNAELIKSVENSPDTVITLTTGEKVIVREGIDEVIEKVIDYRRAVAAAQAPSMNASHTIGDRAPAAPAFLEDEHRG